MGVMWLFVVYFVRATHGLVHTHVVPENSAFEYVK